MKLTVFEFFENTPNFQLNSTIQFKTNQERDDYFNNFKSKKIEKVNFRLDRGVVNTSIPFEYFRNSTYGRFIDGFDGQTYYFFINSTKYINDGTTELSIIIDCLMTFCQLTSMRKWNLTNLNVERQHLPKELLTLHENILRTNDDNIKVHDMRVLKSIPYKLSNLMVMLYTTSNFERDFGNERDPKIPYAQTTIRDNHASSVSIYICSLDEYHTLSLNLYKYPWIGQTINKVVMVPKDILNQDDLEKIDTPSLPSELQLFKFKNRSISDNRSFNFNYTIKDLMREVGLSEWERYLLKSGYINMELTDQQGQRLTFDTGKVKELEFEMHCAVGFQNLIKVILKDYNGFNNDGQGLDYALTLNDFDELPVFVNSSKLSQVNNTFNRQLEESRTFGGRLDTVLNPNSSLDDRLFNGLSVFSSINSISDIAGLLSSDYEFNRTKAVQDKNYSLITPSVSGGRSSHALQFKTDGYYIYLNIYTPSKNDLVNIKRYSKTFGHKTDFLTDVVATDSMRLLNYVKFSGGFKFPNMYPMYSEVLNTLFERGVKFYHVDSKLGLNPFEYDILNNEVVK